MKLARKRIFRVKFSWKRLSCQQGTDCEENVCYLRNAGGSCLTDVPAQTQLPADQTEEEGSNVPASPLLDERQTDTADNSGDASPRNSIDLDLDEEKSLSKGSVRSSARVPSIPGQAILVRTPAKRSYSPSVAESLSVYEVEPEQMLITELEESEYRKNIGLEDRSDYSEEESDDSFKEVFQREATKDENDWDTDLDIEEPLPTHDPTGKSQYEKICGSLGVTPISYFVRHINDHAIVMRYHGLGPAAAKALALVLRENITLEKLNIQGNWIEGEGGRAMSRMLEENDYITEMGLADNKLGSLGAIAVCKMLSVNGGLRKLDLAGNDFGEDDAEYFAKALDCNKFLRELDLSRNRFGERAGEVLGLAIGGNEVLSTLDLSWNNLCSGFAIPIANGIKENIRIKVFRIAWNGLGPEGGAAMADALETNSSLIELDISGNRLNAEAAIKIAKSLETNETLEILRIGNNFITTAGAIALVTAINNFESGGMQILDLTDIPVEFEFLRICEDIKLKKPDFKVIHGYVMRSGNTIDDIGKPSIDPFKKTEPVLVLREHIVINDDRVVNVLQRYDTDANQTVTSDEFLAAIDELAVPYNRAKLEEAIKRMADESGRIYFGDFLRQKYIHQDSREGTQTPT
ncbi:hypothetical protein ScPMuIL_014231 [Solemya velum]